MRGLRAPVAAGRLRRAGALPAMRQRALDATEKCDPEHVGTHPRRGDLLHPGEHPAGAEYDYRDVHGGRHHSGRSCSALHNGIVATGAHCANRQRGHPARQVDRAFLSAALGTAPLDRGQSRACPALPTRRNRRAVVDAGCVCRHFHRRTHSAPAAHVGEARSRRHIFCGGRRVDDDRGCRPSTPV